MKKAIHVKEYTRKKHGRAKFGGKVSSHNKSGRAMNATRHSLSSLYSGPVISSQRFGGDYTVYTAENLKNKKEAQEFTDQKKEEGYEIIKMFRGPKSWIVEYKSNKSGRAKSSVADKRTKAFDEWNETMDHREYYDAVREFISGEEEYKCLEKYFFKYVYEE